jgi:decaprenylphospho-beta-D-erythro-pentofuranosid-2-ulose 2-reductase
MAVAVFGATSRAARAVALRWAERGHDVGLAARDLTEAERLASDVSVRTGVRALGVSFDATDSAAFPALVARIEAELGPLTHALVAFGDLGDPTAAQADPAALRRILETNFVGAAVLLEALSAPMASRRAGALAVIGSVAGDRGRQSNYAYGSAKGGLEVFVSGLRNRLHPLGVHVLLVKPGFIDSPMTWGLQTRIPVASPESLAEAIVRDLDARVDTRYHPAFWQGIMGVISAIPEVIFKRLRL